MSTPPEAMGTPLAAAAEVRAEVREVIREACAAIGWVPRHGADAVAPRHGAGPGADEAGQRAFYAEVHERGWAVPHWPVAYGGQGRPLSDLLIFHEEAIHYGAPSQYNRVAIGIAGPALLEFGTQEQKERYLPRIADGSQVWCQGFSEPGAGSDLAALQTKAKRSEDGWTVNGQKVWTTLGHVADYCLALVRTGTTGHGGISALVVPMRQTGVTVRPIRQITGESDFTEVFFDNAVVASDGVVGDVDGGWRVAMRALEHERSVNFLERQLRLDDLLADLTRLVQRLEPVADLRTDAVRLLADAAGLRYAVRDYIERFLGGLPAGTGINGTKVRWSETYRAVTRLGLRAAQALAEPDTIATWSAAYYASLSTPIYGGTNEIQRDIVAERGLGLPRTRGRARKE
ncbi:acyl-CoA dehydrogenase family protein [Streptomyces sp. NPDC001984]